MAIRRVLTVPVGMRRAISVRRASVNVHPIAVLGALCVFNEREVGKAGKVRQGQQRHDPRHPDPGKPP